MPLKVYPQLLLRYHPHHIVTYVVYTCRNQYVCPCPSLSHTGAPGRVGGLPWRREGWRDPLSSDAEQQLRQSDGGRGERRVGFQPQDLASEVGAARRPGQGHHQTQGAAGFSEVPHTQLKGFTIVHSVWLFVRFLLFLACSCLCVCIGSGVDGVKRKVMYMIVRWLYHLSVFLFILYKKHSAAYLLVSTTDDIYKYI